MMIPVRCFTCGKPIGHLWDDFKSAEKARKNTKNTLDTLGLERYCCRSVFLTHVDLIEKIGMFKR
jgi:DNA-directed RNA polymerase subunit N (RpoN/RPB10)